MKGTAWALIAASGAAGLVTGLGTRDGPALRPSGILEGPARRAAVRSVPFHASVTEADRAQWASYRRRFIHADGRVIDSGNDDVSHTEGQGYGLLFAVAFNDRAVFDSILNWTESHLTRPGDALHSWRYDPRLENPVSDINNATDGDLMIAWALWKASFLWGDAAYADLSRKITADILGLLVIGVGDRTILLPGGEGFQSLDSTIVNLSYYCFPALADLAQAVPSPKWARLHADGIALIEQGRFGSWALPPDWLSISNRDGSLSLAEGRPPRFSADAIRIPLFLAWARQCPRAVQSSFDDFWMENRARAPAWVDLRDGTMAGYRCSAGSRAVSTLLMRDQGKMQQLLPVIASSDDYYSSSLMMLSRLARYEAA